MSEVKGECGACISIEKKYACDSSVNLDSLFSSTRMAILRDTTHVKGIGRYHQERLARRRVASMRGLLFASNASWRKQAARLLEMVNSSSLDGLKKHPSIKDLDLLFCFTPTRVIYLDIETSGLFGSRVFLVGLGYYNARDGTLDVQQFFARNYEEEYAVIKHTMDKMKQFDCIVTYNGKSFDIPMLDDKFWYYFNSSTEEFVRHHVDLVHESRRVLGLGKKAKLSQLERAVLKLQRDIDVSSSHIPRIYGDYVEAGAGIDVISLFGGLFTSETRDPFNGLDDEFLSEHEKATVINMYRIIHHNLVDITSLHYLLEQLLKVNKKNNGKHGK